MLPVTSKARDAAQGRNIKPNLVLEIEGYDRYFSLNKIISYIRVGDPNLYIGDDWEIGGDRPVDNQDDVISLDGTTDSISQQLAPDKGGASSVTSIQISLLDVHSKVTELISPGVILPDLMGRRAWVWLGFSEDYLRFPEDYVILFAGVIDDIISEEKISINVAHPEQKKRQEIFTSVETELAADIDAVQTTIELLSVADLKEPDGENFFTYVQINDEIVQYTGINTVTNELTGCVRGCFGTIADTGEEEDSVSSFYRLTGACIDLALKMMLSEPDKVPYLTELAITAFVTREDGSDIANSLFFLGLDVKMKYGMTVGDLLTVDGSLAGLNDFTDKAIESIEVNDMGSTVVVSGVTLVPELDTPAVLSIFSQYNTLPDGLGLGSDQVDIEEFERIFALFNSSIPSYDFYITDTINGKDFIDKELLFPANMFTIPRKGRVSAGIISPPLAVASLVHLDTESILNPDQIKTRRTTQKYFYNTVIVKYDFDAVEQDKAQAGYILKDDDSKNRIAFGTKAYTITSQGLRRGEVTDQILDINAVRLLDRYKYAAEFVMCKIAYGKGYRIDVGDIVLFGDADLPIVDSKFGRRGLIPRLYMVADKKMSIKSGQIDLTLVDTNYLVGGRFGIISPSTVIGSGSTTSRIQMTDSFGTAYPEKEKDKWIDFIDQNVYIHNEDYSYEAETKLLGFDPDDETIMIVRPLDDAPLDDAPLEGMIIDIPNYGDSADYQENETYKNVFVYNNPQLSVVTGTSELEFEVSVGDADLLFVGCTIIVHNADYSSASDEVTVESIDGTTVVVSADLGFTPDNTYRIDLVGFASDQGEPYRLL